MKADVVLSPAAIKDAAEIAAGLGARNPARATAFIKDLGRRCLVIGRTPGTGTARGDLLDGLYTRSFGPHVLFYTARHGTVRVERILHGSRYVPRLQAP